MKRYLAFFGEQYYPLGGMDDFIGDFNTQEDAVEAIESALTESKKNALDFFTKHPKWCSHWADIFDTETREKVYTTIEK